MSRPRPDTRHAPSSKPQAPSPKPQTQGPRPQAPSPEAQAPSPRPQALFVFLILYCLSGAAALLYEVAWLRLLALHLGHTVAAVSTVLTAFMGGLAVGALLAGRRAAAIAPARALRACALFEVLIAISALLVPFALLAARPLVAAAYADGSGAWFGITRVVVALAALTVPTLAMGATFPMAVRALEAPGRTRAGEVYAANTLGAAIGAALAGFVLLPAFGLRGTTFVGIALNLAAAIGFFTLSRARAAVGAPALSAPGAPAPSAPAPSAPRAPSAPSAPASVIAIGVSGFIALAYEVAWTRVLAMVIGPTSYAFSGMLVTFIGGLAIGAVAGAALARRMGRPLLGLAATFLIATMGTAIALTFTGRGPIIVGGWVARPDASFGWIVSAELALVGALLLPITMAFGAAFPLALAAIGETSLKARATDTSLKARATPTATSAARVYVANTVGAITGSLAAGWLLIPALGLRGTLVSLAVAGAVAAAVLALVAGTRGFVRASIGTAAAVVGTLVVMTPRWDPEVLSGGAYKYAPYLRGGDLETGLSAGALLYYREGAAGTVSVRKTAGSIALAIDGKVDASNDADMLTQRLLAHLPLVLHPAPREVAIIGLGSGVTAGSALAHDVARVDVLEISPQVVEASAHFAADNRGALRDPRLRLIVGDGRSHLALGRRTYDVIISEPSNPWMAGVAGLFTREFFESARARLSPRGLLCQWSHTYDITAADLRSIAATFSSVFPDGTMWLVGEGDLLLIGGPSGVQPEADRIARALARPEVRADLAGVGVRSPFELLSLFAGDGEDLRAFAQGAAIQTDSRLALEFSAPRAIFGRSSDENARDLRARAAHARRPEAVSQALAAATAANWRDRGLMLLASDANTAAFDDLARAARLNPGDRSTLEALGRAAGAADRVAEADRLLAELAARDAGNIPVRLERSRLAAARGEYALARKLVIEAGKAEPRNLAVLEQLASVVADEQDAEGLSVVVQGLESAAPNTPATLYYAASLEFLKGNPPKAAELAERAVALRPGDHRAHNLAGAAYGAIGRADRAREAFRAALRASPEDPIAYVNLGTLELQAANAAAAGEYFSDALALDPGSSQAREGLARALEILGDTRRAAAVRRGT
jgi:spermidine synthase